MAIKSEAPAPKLAGVQVATFQTSAQWVTGLWGLRATGRVRVEDGGKILIEVLVPPGSDIKPGSVVTGNLTHAILPTSVGPPPVDVRHVAPGGDS